MNFGLVGILSGLSVTACGLDAESMLQVSQLPPGILDPSAGGQSAPPAPSSCEDDCSCPYLEYIDGTYVYEDFFPVGTKNEEWCFPDIYTEQTCISVTCSMNTTSCTFGTLTMELADLATPGDTSLEIKMRLEPDFLNFSVGVVQTGMTFESVSSCELPDGTPAVCSSPTSLSVGSRTIDMVYPRCIEAFVMPTAAGIGPSSGGFDPFSQGFGPTFAPTPSPLFPPTLAPTPSPLFPPTLAPTPSPVFPPTLAPTPSPPTAGASGDPHCTNIKGENFDVYKRGKINMVTIPQGRDAAEADFSVVVVVTPTWWKTCAASFISLAVITRESSCEQIKITPGDGLMPEVEKLPDAERRCNQTSTIDKIGENAVLLKIGERKVKFWQTTKYDKYLNMEIYGLANEQQKVGGILGLDDHEDESEVPEECKRGKRVSSKESDHRVTSISYARII